MIRRVHYRRKNTYRTAGNKIHVVKTPGILVWFNDVQVEHWQYSTEQRREKAKFVVILAWSFKVFLIWDLRNSRDYLSQRELLLDLMVAPEVVRPLKQGKTYFMMLIRIMRAFLLEELKELKKMKVVKDQKKKGKKKEKTSKK